MDLQRTKYQLYGGYLIRCQDDAKADISVYNMAMNMKLFKTTWNFINKYPLIGDSLLALVIAVFAFFNLRALWILQPPNVNSLLAGILVGLMIIPLAWRRIFPLAALSTATIAIVALQVLNIPEGNFMGIISIIAVFSAATYGGRRRNAAKTETTFNSKIVKLNLKINI